MKPMVRLLPALLLLLVAPALAAEERPEPTPDARCTALCRGNPCESYEFAGFSPDSDRCGYSHLTCPGPHDQKEARYTWHVRRIRPGKRKLSTAAIVVEAETWPSYFRKEEYRVEELPSRQTGKQRYEFNGERGLKITVELATEKKVAWYFSVEDENGERFRYRGEFEEIYFGIQPRIFVSPNGQRAAVVLLLDAMVKVDAALVLFSLNP
jgi:hypothetical protein